MRNTSELLTWLNTHVYHDLVEIRHISIRDNYGNCTHDGLMYTLHSSIKYTKCYSIIYVKARQCLGQSVKYSKLE